MLVLVLLLALVLWRNVAALKQEAYIETMQGDLRRYVMLQEHQIDSTGAYVGRPEELNDFRLGKNVVLFASRATDEPAWDLLLMHRRIPAVCALSVGGKRRVTGKLICQRKETARFVVVQSPDRDVGFTAVPVTESDLDSPVALIAWNFGDGTFEIAPLSQMETTSHIFRSPGTYRVRLAVLLRDGELLTASHTVEID
ncbi:MAG TPA: PKD domain-containing protein [Gemmatimonadaceae bacterium]